MTAETKRKKRPWSYRLTVGLLLMAAVGLVMGLMLGRYRRPEWPQRYCNAGWGFVNVTPADGGGWLFTYKYTSKGTPHTYRLLPDCQIVGIPLDELPSDELVGFTAYHYNQELDGGIVCTMLELRPTSGGKEDMP